MSSAVLICSPEVLELAFAEPVLRRLRPLVSSLEIVAPADAWPGHREALQNADVLFSGWGAPKMDAAFLRAMPKLRAVFYAGGSVRYFVTEAFWQAGVRLTTAQALNAIPVAEYAASMLQLGLKRVWHFARVTRELRSFPASRPLPGTYGSTIGLVSYGIIARLTRERLRSLDCTVIVYDPFLSEADAAREGVRKVELDELFATADAVSIHTPKLPETAGLIRGHHVAAMKPDSFFLNTARGEVLNEPEVVEVLRRRLDLQAVLDVTAPEPPRPDSPLYTLPNVFLTPHLAGSVGAECQRMGLAMIAEFERYRAGVPLRWEIDAERAALIA
jgi:phosphoglycerate dehydrogenase-like enzyme